MDVTCTPEKADPEKVLAILDVAAAKRNARVLHGREDDLIRSHILAAFEFLDGVNGFLNGYSILERQFQVYLPDFCGPAEIKVRPLQEESFILGTRDAAGTYVDAPAGAFALFKQDEAHFLGSVDLQAIQQARVAHPRAVRLSFKAGHADPKDVPDGIRQAMMLLTGHYYQNREAAFADPRSGVVSREIVYGVKALVRKFRFTVDHD